MKPLARKQKIILALLLLIFAVAKITALWWWQRQQPVVADPITAAACHIRQGCTLANGARVYFGPQGSAKAPFDILVERLPDQVQQVAVSFSMRGMDMGFNRYALQKQPDGSWQGRQIRLPVCVDERNDYLADIIIDNQPYTIPFRIP